MIHQPRNLLPKNVWIVFAAFCLFGIVTGALGGSDNLSDILFSIALFGTPVLFTAWVVIKLNLRWLGHITGHERCLQSQRRRERQGDGNVD